MLLVVHFAPTIERSVPLHEIWFLAYFDHVQSIANLNGIV